MGADGYGWRRSRVGEYMVNMQDKIGNDYSSGYGYINWRLLIHGTIMETRGRGMMKNKSYTVTGGERHYIF